MIFAYCSFNILVIRWALTLDPPDGQNPMLDIGGSQQKDAMPDLYFKVVDPKLQVADLKAEVGSWDPAGPPI